MDLGFSSIFILSRVMGRARGEVWRAKGWALDFPLYLSLLVLWVRYGGRQGGPWIFLYIYPFSCCG
jgi:hypothetical protein